ncbi:MAG: phosphotransferase [Acidobacteria bacterium]|nr:phosphotransferase [Acidobacteriota bacterium]
MIHPQHDTDTWRILLFASKGTELLALKRPLGFGLPVLQIPRQERIAESLNAEARRVWNLETVCVAPLLDPQRTSDDIRYHVMEVLRPEELRRIAPQAMDLSTLRADAFADERDYRAIRRAMKLDASETSDDHSGPFSDFGRFEEIADWVEAQLAHFGRKWDGEFRQLHVSAFFSLIRFRTKGDAVWFKATGEPNQLELAITERLSALFPQYVPAVLAVRRDWNAWLANEVMGRPLDANRDLDAWCRAAESLAELQIASIDHVPALLGSGARDSRTTHLASQVGPFFAEMEKLMETQTKLAPPKLAARELRSTSLRVLDALSQMEADAIPDALNHFDMNPGNIVVCTDDCKFLDWAEAAVGNPFFSFEFLRQHFVRAFADEPEAEFTLRNSYLNPWRRLLRESTIKRALACLPLVGPFAFAAVTLPGNASQQETECAGLLRSLARRMHRAGQTLRAA